MGPHPITGILIRERQKRRVIWPQGKECQQIPEPGKQRRDSSQRVSRGSIAHGFQPCESNIELKPMDYMRADF